jgi:2-polyprenyl-3-methyl-5-hydroxy-6-metoxy-1,4-benzoquinol methylase
VATARLRKGCIPTELVDVARPLANRLKPLWVKLPRSVRRMDIFRGIRDRLAGVKVITTIEELEEQLKRLDDAPTFEEQKQVFGSFYMKVDRSEPLDPDSDAYRDRELRIYQWLSGKAYAPENEVTTVNVEEMAKRPFPYFTQSPMAVGDQLMGIGFVIRTLDLPKGASVLEFGAGWGNLTIQLALMGYDVTAVDIAPDFIEIMRQRAKRDECELTLIHGDFEVASRIDKQFDCVLFFASFHHCKDPVALIGNLDKLVKPGGRIAFSAEPITDRLDVPWGIRLDGESLWAIHRNGWFETGFTEEFFRELMGRHGWVVERKECPLPDWGLTYIATRASEQPAQA